MKKDSKKVAAKKQNQIKKKANNAGNAAKKAATDLELYFEKEFLKLGQKTKDVRRKTEKVKPNKKEKAKNEKLRRLRISRSHAIRSEKKLANKKDKKSKELRRAKFKLVMALNHKINTIEYKEKVFDKFEASEGWKMQSFGHAGRASDNFFKWITGMAKFFTDINGIPMPSQIDVLMIYVNDLINEMDSEDILRIKYQQTIGFVYYNNSNLPKEAQ